MIGSLYRRNPDGVVNQGLVFDGLMTYVSVQNSAAITLLGGVYTIELWGYFPTLPPAFVSVLMGTRALGLTGWSLFRNPAFAGLELAVGNERIAANPNALFNDSYHHVAIVSDNANNPGQRAVYIDGVDQFFATVGTGGSGPSGNDIIIGARADLTRFVDATLDEVRIWSGAINPADITPAYRKNPNGPGLWANPSDLLLRHSYNGNALDLSGNGRNGTLMGFGANPYVNIDPNLYP